MRFFVKFLSCLLLSWFGWKNATADLTFSMNQVSRTDRGHTSPCCTPRKWETSTMRVNKYTVHPGVDLIGQQVSRDMSGDDLVRGRVSYDYTLPAMALSLHVRDKFNGRLRYMNVTTVLRGNKVYFTEPGLGTCRKFTLPTAFAELCVPSNGKLTMSPVIGLKGALKTNTFVGSQRGWWGAEQYSMTVTDADCVPVIEAYSGMVRGLSYQREQLYYDISAEVKDESVFNVPNVCNESRSVVEILSAMPEQLKDMTARMLKI